ncbi:hypothetical protein BGX34_005836 [Mortierella sp. NVP85]|nr:hypothetical protein BGX34_005836 [Mortierella sp. NVP85]
MIATSTEILDTLGSLAQSTSLTLADAQGPFPSEGHVKWVCFDGANYKDLVIQKLRDIVEVHRGEYIEVCKIKITIEASIHAKPFYGRIDQSTGMQELDITLE